MQSSTVHAIQNAGEMISARYAVMILKRESASLMETDAIRNHAAP
jgi:hypothetical protein